MTSKELIRKLKKLGWKDKELIIPFHTKTDLKPGTLHRLLKDAGLK
jgi:predicted RNA binding protein YcfA (HicA-like mRNA interferase family)